MIVSLSLLLLFLAIQAVEWIVIVRLNRRIINIREQVAREHGYSVTQHRDARGNYDLSFPPMQIAG